MNFPEVGQGDDSGLGAAFLKLKDGEKARGVFMGDPHIFRQHWIGNRSKPCTGEDDKDACEHCKAGDKDRFRFRVNFITKIDEVWVAKVFEQGYRFYLDLKEMHENAYPLPTTLVSLSRSGSGKDTLYRIMPIKDNGGWKAENFKKLSAIPLNDLSNKAEDGPPKDGAPPPTDDDIPF